MTIGLFQGKVKPVGLRAYFFKQKPKSFRFVTLPLDILDKIKFYPYKFRKIALYLLEIIRLKMTTYVNST